MQVGKHMSNELVHIDKLYAERLWVIKGYSIEPASVDAWEAAVRDYLRYTNNAPQRYLVYDLLPIQKLGFTLYMRQRVTALAEDTRNASGRVGIAMNINPMLRYVFEPFLRFTGKYLQPGLDVKLFANREAAIQWVAAILPPADS